jgi:hypothetical protein
MLGLTVRKIIVREGISQAEQSTMEEFRSVNCCSFITRVH